MLYYPQGDSVPVDTDALAATPEGHHILGASVAGSGITLSDIGVTIPTQVTGGISTPIACPMTTTGSGSTEVQTLYPLTISHAVNPITLTKVSNVTAVNQVVTGSLPQLAATLTQTQSLAFITYDGSTSGALLPYYLPASSGAGALNYVTLMDGSSPSTTVTAPITGVFSPDNSTFFVSTAGDNQVHFISIPSTATGTFSDTKQISPNLPVCTPVSSGGTDAGCTYTGSGTIVPATAIVVKPRSTT
jgi:hypothetical protein